MAEQERRPLTQDEMMILGFIQKIYGEHNTPEDVFISHNNEAVIFVKDRSGSSVLGAALTSLALTFHEEGKTPEDFCRTWLQPH